MAELSLDGKGLQVKSFVKSIDTLDLGAMLSRVVVRLCDTHTALMSCWLQVVVLFFVQPKALYSLRVHSITTVRHNMARSPSEHDPLVEVKSDDDDSSNRFPLSESCAVGQKILNLAIPAAGALLIDPLMTLADTAFVGRYADSSAALAGMGSATPLVAFSFYLFNFLCTVTTPLIAEQRAAGNGVAAETIGGQALSLALGLGGVLAILLSVGKQTLLYAMGTGVTGDEANGYALGFLAVRALAAPAYMCIEASTGVLRGYLDTKTPIVVLIVANILNLVLDVVLIAYAGMGPMGAAIATTSAEWVSAGLFLSVMSGWIPSVTGPAGRHSSKLNVKPTMSIPSWIEISPLLLASSAVFFRAVALQVSLAGAAAMVARMGGKDAASAAAAHQIGKQLWLLCSFFCDSLAAASQGLVADAIGRRDQYSVREVSKTVFLYSLVLGVCLTGLLQTASSLGFISDIFTNDKDIKTDLTIIIPIIVFAQPLNAMVFAADGILQGASEFQFQARAMLLSGLIAAATYLVLNIQYGCENNLLHVWLALLTLQGMRGLTSAWKIIQQEGPVDLLCSKN